MINNFTPEKILIIKQQVAESLNMSIEEFTDGFREGSIRVCKGIGNGTHVGKFHRNGQGWRYICIECSKEIRRKQYQSNKKTTPKQ